MGSDGSGRSGFTEEIAFPAARAAERLGRYELLAPLGKGGMASVFLARLRGPSGFEKLLAIKRIHPALTEDPRFVDMFLDEARVAAALQHPNIAQVFELGHEGSVYFLAMEYLHGEHLGDVLGRAAKDRAPLPVELACWIVARVAEALHHAHEATDALGRPLSIIHRDVSPQNIFVTYAGNAKLTDFGVAKASSNVVETDTGTVKGKFAYMAPEQALGHEIDRRVDVFALGTVLWEALAGRRLFRAATDAQTLLNVTRCEVPPLPPIRREVSEDLDSIVQCALAADPSGRFETAGALARALSRQCTDVSAEDVRAWMHAHFRAGGGAQARVRHGRRRGRGADGGAGGLELRGRRARRAERGGGGSLQRGADARRAAPPRRRRRPPSPPPSRRARGCRRSPTATPRPRTRWASGR
ncbi:MAG: serine/threonine protein kinase [Sandaracinaceae bacterium]|nr:serine/threonine protein kinase [Sandaracinaceae bacterium]